MIRFKGISVYENKHTIEGYYFYDNVLNKHYILNDDLVRFEVAEHSIRQKIGEYWLKIKIIEELNI